MAEGQIFSRQGVGEMKRLYSSLNFTTKLNPYLDLHCFQVMTNVIQ